MQFRGLNVTNIVKKRFWISNGTLISAERSVSVPAQENKPADFPLEEIVICHHGNHC